MEPSATFLNNVVEQFDETCCDASHGMQEEIGGSATGMDPEEKVITNYVASHFVRDSGILQAQIILLTEEEIQNFDQVSN